MKFIYLKGVNNITVPIDADDIAYVDAAADKQGNLIVNKSVVFLKSRYAIQVEGGPQVVGRQIEEQIKVYEL